MKAVGLYEYGGPDVLQIVDIPVPVPGPGEVLVRVTAVPVNPTDVTFRKGGRAAQQEGQPRPLVPGFDFAGHVSALGPDATGRLTVGEPVVGLAKPFSGSAGSYAAFVVADEASVVRAPAGTSLADASTLILNALTAQVALDALDLKPGETVLVTGAAGAVGGFATQLAHRAGYRVVALVRPSDASQVTEWGADRIIDRGPEAMAHIGAMFPDGVDGAVDAADLRDQLIPVLRDNGRIASLKGWAPEATSAGVTVIGIVGPSESHNTELLLELVEKASRHELALRVSAILPYSAAADAHRLVGAVGVRGRVVLDFSSAA